MREPGPSGADAATVTSQLGRIARGDWRVAARCRWGAPTVIAVAPLVDGAPFPTVLWLTCPWLRRLVDGAESAGAAARWTERIASEAHLAGRVSFADRAYRRLRLRLGGGTDPCDGVGIAGQADPLVVKCLHARVAAALGGAGDPVGAGLLREITEAGGSIDCPGAPCGPPTGGGDVAPLG